MNQTTAATNLVHDQATDAPVLSPAQAPASILELSSAQLAFIGGGTGAICLG